MRFKLMEKRLTGSLDSYINKIKRSYERFDPSGLSVDDYKEIIRRLGINHDCADYVGAIVKILNTKRDPSYEVHIGLSSNNTRMTEDEINHLKAMTFANHCWVKYRGKYYEISEFSRTPKIYSYEVSKQFKEL